MASWRPRSPLRNTARPVFFLLFLKGNCILERLIVYGLGWYMVYGWYMVGIWPEQNDCTSLVGIWLVMTFFFFLRHLFHRHWLHGQIPCLRGRRLIQFIQTCSSMVRAHVLTESDSLGWFKLPNLQDQSTFLSTHSWDKKNIWICCTVNMCILWSSPSAAASIYM